MIIPTFNGGAGLDRSIVSLHRQTLRPMEIIVVDDGSTDETRAFAERARAQGLVDTVICHGTRCGRSPAINAGVRFARGDLILTVDADTEFEPTAVARLAAVFEDPRVGGASGNIAIRNDRESIWTGLQSVEYLMSITAGRSVLDAAGAIACLSGACSMYRRDVLLRQGGLDVGPGEDLEYQPATASPRLSHPVCAGRHGGNRWPGKRHKPPASARTLGPRCVAYPIHDVRGVPILPSARASARTRSQRLDFIVFDLVPTLTLPFYLAYVILRFGSDAALFLAAIYVLLLGFSIFNMALAFAMFNRSVGFFGLGAALIFPFYQGVYLKFARFFSYSSEIIFATSQRDDFVPPRVRRALFGEGAAR